MSKYAILTYHQIAEPPPRPAGFRSLYVPPARFAFQMRLLQRLGYRGLSMPDLMPYLYGEREGKVVGITLDDGYRNNLQHALPVLQECGFTATCYVMSDLLGQTNRWDFPQGVLPADLMSADQIRQWVRAGMDIGAHTRSHPRLPMLPDALAQQEIAGCKSALENIVQQRVAHFCYPFGMFSPQHATMARAAGYVSATTTVRGKVQLGDDLFTLVRVPVARSTYLAQFLLKIFTSYENQRPS